MRWRRHDGLAIRWLMGGVSPERRVNGESSVWRRDPAAKTLTSSGHKASQRSPRKPCSFVPAASPTALPLSENPFPIASRACLFPFPRSLSKLGLPEQTLSATPAILNSAPRLLRGVASHRKINATATHCDLNHRQGAFRLSKHCTQPLAASTSSTLSVAAESVNHHRLTLHRPHQPQLTLLHDDALIDGLRTAHGGRRPQQEAKHGGIEAATTERAQRTTEGGSGAQKDTGV